jgi:pyrroline-5-carboxylate reductase
LFISTSAITQLGVIGAGTMGRALVKGLLNRQVLTPHHIWASNRSEASCQKARDELGIMALKDYTERLPGTDVVLVCVKPHQMPTMLKQLMTRGLTPDTLVISIAAGVTLAAMQGVLGDSQPLIRAMTNTPCQVGQGMTVMCGNEATTPAHMAKAQLIFDAVGQCMEMDEAYFDAITGLCGSGPAYLYLIMEALADGGVRVGLPRDKALKLVAQTVLGAATMLQQTGRHPASLRDDVTTPAGCTIGALLSMEDGKIRSVLARAVEEATRIAGSLG